MREAKYPWYDMVEGRNLRQGDIIEACPVFLPPADLDVSGDSPQVTFDWEKRDVVVMTQSCDLVEGQKDMTEVLLCPVYLRSEIRTGHLANPKGMEDARRGDLPAYHVLARCPLPALEREVRVVDFRHVYSLPLALVRSLAEAAGPRIRLLPPYREHLAQAFARFFMRVGLPVDIPSFV